MRSPAAISLTRDEARGLMLMAQGLYRQPETTADLSTVRAMIEQLGVLQVDTINVVRRTQYLVLWSRLGAYDDSLLDQLLYPHRAVFEYWSHAASIVPMADFPYYRSVMLNASEGLIWDGLREWRDANPEMIAMVLDRVRAEGPLGSSAFENPNSGRKAEPWEWYGKDSRRALDVLWTMGELMIHSRRGGQKVYDLRERVVAEAFGQDLPRDDALPSHEERVRYLTNRTVKALGVVAPSWLWDYFRLRDFGRHHKLPKRAAAEAALTALAKEGLAVPAQIEGFSEPAWVAAERLPSLENLRNGERMARTTLLSPFDALIWDRARARALFDYEVVFEAYVVPHKRKYGYYCLAILHQGRLVGRLDPKMDRETGELAIRALYLEPHIVPDADLASGLAESLRDLATFLGAQRIVVQHADPVGLAPMVRECLGLPKRRAKGVKKATKQGSE